MIVDFNTADPLIRWDSYENLSADGEGVSHDFISYWREGPGGGGCSRFRLEMLLESAQRLGILGFLRSGAHTFVGVRALMRTRCSDLGSSFGQSSDRWWVASASDFQGFLNGSHVCSLSGTVFHLLPSLPY